MFNVIKKFVSSIFNNFDNAIAQLPITKNECVASGKVAVTEDLNVAILVCSLLSFYKVQFKVSIQKAVLWGDVFAIEIIDDKRLPMDISGFRECIEDKVEYISMLKREIRLIGLPNILFNTSGICNLTQDIKVSVSSVLLSASFINKATKGGGTIISVPVTEGFLAVVKAIADNNRNVRSEKFVEEMYKRKGWRSFQYEQTAQ